MLQPVTSWSTHARGVACIGTPVYREVTGKLEFEPGAAYINTIVLTHHLPAAVEVGGGRLKSASQSISQSISQPVSQPVSQSASKSASQLVNQPAS